jgi:L-asparaginase
MLMKIFTVGGTIDKIYFDELSTYQVGEPNISKVLSEFNLGFEYSVESIFRKDSLEITEEDRQVVLERVKNCSADKILLTHGTDTMVDTARCLQAVEGKTIVLTGALKPAMFKTTDAVFNIGGAVVALQTLPAGVYIVMNGRVFEADCVVKNREKGIFELTDK